METSFPIRYREFLRQVEIRETPGFKSGLITFGTCADPGGIVQIKLKYADSSKKFYKDLFKLYKARFGEPAEYRGDSFQVLIAWKWSFRDAEGNRISMILQHNLKDPNQKMGNNIKLTMWDLIDKERVLYEQRMGLKQEKKIAVQPKEIKPAEWERLIPK